MNQVRSYMAKLRYAWKLRQQIGLMTPLEEIEIQEKQSVLLLDSKMASTYNGLVSIKNDSELGGHSSGTFEVTESGIKFSGMVDGTGADKFYTPPFVSMCVDVF